MKVKRYIAKDMAEAMIKIKSELGMDAVILNQRRIKQNGIKGFFSKPLIEVVAAIDEDRKPASVPQATQPAPPKVEPEVIKPEVKIPQTSADNNDKEIQRLNSEISSIKVLLENILTGKQENPAFGRIIKKDSTALEKSADSFDLIASVLKEHDIDEEFAHELKAKISSRLEGNPTPEKIKVVLKEIIKDIVGKTFTIEDDYPPQKVFFFVGPTGVGKTTTLAKLAARLSLINNKKIGLITADTYRIAAVDQLRTYSEILGLPLSVVYEPDEMRQAIQKYKDKDFVLVDTAGRSHKSEELEKDLKSLLECSSEREIFLVISLTTGYKDIKSMLDSYSFLGDYKVIFTKLDESSSYGNILNVQMITGRPLSYFTIGQSVPDDIEIASAEKVANFIVGDK